MSYCASNTEAIYLEYPFLAHLWKRRKVRNAKVKRFDDEFADELALKGGSESGLDYRPTLFLDANGTYLARVGRFGWLEYIWPTGESVGEALERIGDLADQVHYVVSFDGGTLVLGRTPRGFDSIGAWWKKRVEEKRAQIDTDDE